MRRSGEGPRRNEPRPAPAPSGRGDRPAPVWRILDYTREELLREERQLLGDLRVLMIRLGSREEEQKALARSTAQLEELFLLVVVGEFNSGKSTVINGLLGQRVVEDGVTPTTSRIGMLKHGKATDRTLAGGVFEVITVPLDLLRDLTIVDTPGTNAVMRGHEALTRDFVPRSDLVLFVTSADRPFTESERSFLEAIRSWGKKVVVAINKVDILENREDVTKVAAFVREQVDALLGFRPEVFPVSARQALRAKGGRDTALLRTSGFPDLEAFLKRSLEGAERLRLKLLNPLGVGIRNLDTAARAVQQRRTLMGEDTTVLRDVEGQLKVGREDRVRTLRGRLAELEKALRELEKRGLRFLDRALRLGRILKLASGEEVRDEFERDVVADLPRVLDKRVEEVAEWLAASTDKEWQAVVERLEKRRAVHPGRIGDLRRTIDHDRAGLLRDLRAEVQRGLASDHQADVIRWASAVRGTVIGTVLLAGGAVCLAALVVALSKNTTTTVAGLLVTGALLLAGLSLLPIHRRKAQGALLAMVAHVNDGLVPALTARLTRELDQEHQRMVEGMAPYSRFVRSEDEQLRGQQEEIAALRKGLEALKARVEALR